MPKSTATKSKATGKAKKDPNAPKRPSTAFIFFSNDERPKVKQEQPELAFGDIAREISARWKAVDEKTKKKYDELAIKDKSRYDRETSSYSKGGSKSAAAEDDDEQDSE